MAQLLDKSIFVWLSQEKDCLSHHMAAVTTGSSVKMIFEVLPTR